MFGDERRQRLLDLVDARETHGVAGNETDAVSRAGGVLVAIANLDEHLVDESGRGRLLRGVGAHGDEHARLEVEVEGLETLGVIVGVGLLEILELGGERVGDVRPGGVRGALGATLVGEDALVRLVQVAHEVARGVALLALVARHDHAGGTVRDGSGRHGLDSGPKWGGGKEWGTSARAPSAAAAVPRKEMRGLGRRAANARGDATWSACPRRRRLRPRVSLPSFARVSARARRASRVWRRTRRVRGRRPPRVKMAMSRRSPPDPSHMPGGTHF